MEDKDKLAAGALLVSILTFLRNIKPLELWLNSLIQHWLDFWARRKIVRRLSEDELTVLLNSKREGENLEPEGLETISLLLLQEYGADRVTVTEYHDNPAGKGMLATVIVEKRKAEMLSVRRKVQKMPISDALWAEIIKIHQAPGNFRYIKGPQDFELPELRDTLVKSGVVSAYYQTLHAAEGHAGALLSISWGKPRLLSTRHLAFLHLSGICLETVLRTIWGSSKTES